MADLKLAAEKSPQVCLAYKSINFGAFKMESCGFALFLSFSHFCTSFSQLRQRLDYLFELSDKWMVFVL